MGAGAVSGVGKSPYYQQPAWKKWNWFLRNFIYNKESSHSSADMIFNAKFISSLER